MPSNKESADYYRERSKEFRTLADQLMAEEGERRRQEDKYDSHANIILVIVGLIFIGAGLAWLVL